ncbi:MAG TPA: hypothetical protein ENH55_23280 [Aurantimonas coralicida]|uniref:Uncharacterized protein n=2 Tax=root TaxID=1 RepID=A0A9C9NHC8_9HYPH|nr:hypothetical protein [Aurantimonas coralicida]HEU01868.1 hypothetical protein [Aurantimonas coralicida]
MFRFALLAALLLPAPAFAQAFDPGPMGDVPGRSMSGLPIVGAPRPSAGPRIPGARVFGDTAEERAYGRDFDDSYLRPVVPRFGRGADVPSELRAMEGRSDLNSVNAGAFARGGPAAIGRSAVTRGRSPGSHRAIIRRSPKQSTPK